MVPDHLAVHYVSFIFLTRSRLEGLEPQKCLIGIIDVHFWSTHWSWYWLFKKEFELIESSKLRILKGFESKTLKDNIYFERLLWEKNSGSGSEPLNAYLKFSSPFHLAPLRCSWVLRLVPLVFEICLMSGYYCNATPKILSSRSLDWCEVLYSLTRTSLHCSDLHKKSFVIYMIGQSNVLSLQRYSVAAYVDNIQCRISLWDFSMKPTAELHFEADSCHFWGVW